MFAEIDDEAIPQCLSRLLEAVPNSLVSLNISSNMLGSQGYGVLQKQLLKFNQLTNLDLSKCKIDSNGAELIAKSLIQNKSTRL